MTSHPLSRDVHTDLRFPAATNAPEPPYAAARPSRTALSPTGRVDLAPAGTVGAAERRGGDRRSAPGPDTGGGQCSIPAFSVGCPSPVSSPTTPRRPAVGRPRRAPISRCTRVGPPLLRRERGQELRQVRPLLVGRRTGSVPASSPPRRAGEPPQQRAGVGRRCDMPGRGVSGSQDRATPCERLPTARARAHACAKSEVTARDLTVPDPTRRQPNRARKNRSGIRSRRTPLRGSGRGGS